MSSEELAGAGIAEPGTGGLTGGDIADLRGALRGPVLESADHGFDDVRGDLERHDRPSAGGDRAMPRRPPTWRRRLGWCGEREWPCRCAAVTTAPQATPCAKAA